MSGLDVYKNLYPASYLYFGNLKGQEVHKAKIPTPTPWAMAAVNWAMMVDEIMEGGTLVVDDVTVLHINEFASNLSDYYALRRNKLMLQLMKDFRLGGAFGECVAEGLIHWAESGFCEAELFRETYKSFFCKTHNRLCEVCDGKGIASPTSSHI